MSFFEQLFVNEEQKHIEVYEKFCKTICNLGLVYKIEIETHSEEVDVGCPCCNYIVTCLDQVRVIVSMNSEFEMKEWYDYEFF